MTSSAASTGEFDSAELCGLLGTCGGAACDRLILVRHLLNLQPMAASNTWLKIAQEMHLHKVFGSLNKTFAEKKTILLRSCTQSTPAKNSARAAISCCVKWQTQKSADKWGLCCLTCRLAGWLQVMRLKQHCNVRHGTSWAALLLVIIKMCKRRGDGKVINTWPAHWWLAEYKCDKFLDWVTASWCADSFTIYKSAIWTRLRFLSCVVMDMANGFTVSEKLPQGKFHFAMSRKFCIRK